MQVLEIELVIYIAQEKVHKVSVFVFLPLL